MGDSRQTLMSIAMKKRKPQRVIRTGEVRIRSDWQVLFSQWVQLRESECYLNERNLDSHNALSIAYKLESVESQEQKTKQKSLLPLSQYT